MRCDLYGLRFVSLSPWVKVFIKVIGPRVFFEGVTAHLVDDGPLNPYFQRDAGHLMTLTSLGPRKIISRVSHYYAIVKP